MWNRIRALVWKEFLQLRRDRLTLVMLLFIPLIQITIYGFLNNDVKHLPTIVLDESRSQESRDFVQAMTATPIQMASAMAAAVNGGTYYQPHLVDKYTDQAGHTATVNPKVIKTKVVCKKLMRGR